MLSEPARSNQPSCPALATGGACDDPATLRGQVLDRDSLHAHAAEIAKAHGKPRLAIMRAGPLRARFMQTRDAIAEAYGVLAADDRSHVDAVPAEEWLLDNRHVVEEQIREIEDDLPWGYLVKLPRISKGSAANYPRIYAACVDYLRHTDARLDPDSIAAYIDGYQTVSPLTIGELWAVPIMMRLGLLLVLSGAARAVTDDTGRERANRWAKELLKAPERATTILDRVAREDVDAPLLVHLWKLLREHEASAHTIEWIRERAAILGGTPEELGHRIHLGQAADQLSVANSITSMRTITTYDWSKFFERSSVVEKLLCEDSKGIYAATEAVSRDRYRHAVERISRQSGLDESTVAKKALELARRHQDGARSQVGYYLEHHGRHELERACNARLTAPEWTARAMSRHSRLFYFGAVFTLTVLASAFAWALVRHSLPSSRDVALIVALLVLSASEIALSTVGAFVVALLPPRLLSRFAFEKGIPAEHRTLVAVPVLFNSIETVDQLIDELEVRALANPDPNLYFALISDFVDAAHEHEDDDEELVDHAVAGIARLNAAHPHPSGLPKYALFHRKRVHNQEQGCFMGWERKRGKLEELNRLILGRGATTSFTVVTAPKDLVASIRYVITLDADTELPRAAAIKLVASLAHPLNRPVLDANRTRVIEGYAVIQPRVGTVPSSSLRSRFARITAGPSGLDPYTTAVSDVYQDLFGEGSYIGKAIYDVRAFTAVHEGRVPENRLLSHDLYEGIFARTALASDIELLDEQPPTYGVIARRAHRWMRGDWQLLALLGGRVDSTSKSARSRRRDLSIVGLWKILDNLRRSLLGPSLILAFILVCALWRKAAPGVVFFLAFVIGAPIALRFFTSLVRAVRSPSAHTSIWWDLRNVFLNTGLSLVLLFDQAVVAIDAILTTLYRLTISKKNLLEWQSTGLDKGGAKTPLRMWLEMPVLGGILVAVAYKHGSLLVATPILVAWMLAPLLVDWLSLPVAVVDPGSQLADTDRRLLGRIARKTWLFFEQFVTAEDNWLPPDNFQEEPRGVIAHRTSPTNIGLYLLSSISARDLGYIGSTELVRRLSNTLDTLDKLEKHEGHILNWYDTTNLKPLEPRYVSTVDSGNLAAYLWTTHQACEELIDRPILGPEALDAVADASSLAGEADHGERPAHDARAVLDVLERTTAMEHEDDWRKRAEHARLLWLDETERLAPHWAWLAKAPSTLAELPAFVSLRDAIAQSVTPRGIAESAEHVKTATKSLLEGEIDDEARAYLTELTTRIDTAVAACASLAERLHRTGERASVLADAMNFTFLYDTDRSLFAIGYNVATARLDGSRYDLLASEARLASLLAIAKGDVPEKHWFHLGRARCRVDTGRVLLSWSGSMFEYLMPVLVMRSFSNSLLDETHYAAINAHRDHGKKHGVPWGVSEAAYNVMDLSMTYQYRAFGVHALGLKPGLEDDLVVASYATALAAILEPEAAARNFEALTAAGLEGPYGFYESIDYTESRVPPNRHGVVVKAYMAHHQGMSLVAIAGVLHGAPMQRRFHADPRIKATELLLQERIPVAAPVLDERTARAPATSTTGEDLSLLEHVALERQGFVRSHLLGHGDLAAIVTSTGAGALTWRGLDVCRYREDQRAEAFGTFMYLKDRKSGETWSAGFEPTRARGSSYSATFSVDHVEIHRKDREIETTTEIVVSPEHAVEVRRITLTNHSDRAVEIDLTTYSEVVLAPRSADVAHRAFSNMFVELEEHQPLEAILATRRPKPGEDPPPWLIQTLLPESSGWGPVEIETSRRNFLGRGRTSENPLAVEQREFKGVSTSPGVVATMRHPLDPVTALRRSITLKPKETARASLITGVAPSRDEALELGKSYLGSAQVDRTFELAWADARVELKHLGVSAAQSFRFQRLLSFVLAPHPSLRSDAKTEEPRGDGRAALWSLGISGDLPLVIVRVDDNEVTDLCREVLVAHEFFRLNNFQMDLLILNEEPAGYLQPLQDELGSLLQSGFAQGHLDQRGGVFLRRAHSMDDRERALVQASARVVLRTSLGSLARQLRLAMTDTKAVTATVQKLAETQAPATPRLLFDNGVGGFTRDSREYIVYGQPPAPWSNVLANASFGSLVTERGGGFTWSTNSQRFRLSPWSNDSVSDPLGEAIYLRDASNRVWKATAGTARHSPGYSSFEGTTAGVHHTLTMVVPPDASVKVSKLKLENTTDAPIKLRVCGYVEWVLGDSRESGRLTGRTSWDEKVGAVFAQNPNGALAARCCFYRATKPVARMTCDRAEFFAGFSTRKAPSFGVSGAATGKSGAGLDPCAALEVDIEIAPHQSQELAFILGDAPDRTAAVELATAWAELPHIEAAITQTKEFWDTTLGGIQIDTPDPALNLMVNRWLLYQVLACRVWGRSAFYQSGGAYGYRDQLQDVLALTHSKPAVAREHLLRAAARQFEEGDVQHWWHPEDGAGIRTHCSDDMLWLAFATIEYVRATQDVSVLDEEISFLTERAIPADQHDLFSSPRASQTKASLYEHCARAIDVGLTSGKHGLPLMRAGDWNDGMDRVGADNKGESVWLGWFLLTVMRDFAPLADSRNDTARASRLREETSRLTQAIDEHAWDGAWYRRAYFDDGSPLGSASSAECKIDAIAQSWSVIAGTGDPKRARRALEEAEAQLVKNDPPMMMLLTPPFDGKGPDPGYLRTYPPGVRENGGQYTHGVLWTVQALAMLGEGERAYSLFSKLNPIHHAQTLDEVKRYAVEPYVVAADIYGSAEHAGRGGWTWYTGAAGWMYRIAVEHLLGIKIEGNTLTVKPCVPDSWKSYTVRIRRGASLYEIKVEPGTNLVVEIDGTPTKDGKIELKDDGSIHAVTVKPRKSDAKQLAG